MHLIFLILILLPVGVLADPVTVAIVIGAVAGAGAATTAAIAAGAAITAAALLTGAAIGAALSLTQYLLTPKPDFPTVKQGNISQLIRSAILPVRWMFGRVRCNGMLAFLKTISNDEGDSLTGQSDGTSLHMVVVLSDGECEDIEAIWITGDRVKVQKVMRGGVEIIEPVDDSMYHGKIALVANLAADGSQGATLRSNFPVAWDATHQLNGVSWVHIELRQPDYGNDTEDRFWTQIPNVEYLLKGKKITWPGQAIAVWTESAAAIRHWWLTNRRLRPDISIDDASVISAHSLCEELVSIDIPVGPSYTEYYDAPEQPTGDDPTGWTNSGAPSAANPLLWFVQRRRETDEDDWSMWSIPDLNAYYLNGSVVNVSGALPADNDTLQTRYVVGTNSTSEIRYSLNGVFSSGDRVEEIERQLDFCWQGFVVEQGGVHFFRPGSDRPVAFDLTPDDIIKVGAFQPAPALQQRVNAVSMTLSQSREHDYQAVDLPTFRDEQSITRDGEYRPQDIGSQDFILSPVTAGRLMSVTTRRTRASAILKYQINPGNNMEHFSIIPTDKVTITDPVNGFDMFRCIVSSITVLPDWKLDLGLIEDRDGVYDDDLTLRDIQTRNVLGVRVAVPPARGIVSDEIAEIQVGGSYIIYLIIMWNNFNGLPGEVRYRLKVAIGTDPNDWEYIQSNSNMVRIPNVIAGEVYEFQLRHIDRRGKSGSWSDIIENTIGGDLTPAGQPTAYTINPIVGGYEASWTNPPDKDFHLIRIYDAPQGSAFANAIQRGSVAGEIFQRSSVGSVSDLVVWLRSVDRAGNLGQPVSMNVQTIAPTAGQGGIGDEPVYAITDNIPILISQRPLNSWGYNIDGTVNGVTWSHTAPNVTASNPFLLRSFRNTIGQPSVGDIIADDWSIPTVIGHFGSGGADGTDGID